MKGLKTAAGFLISAAMIIIILISSIELAVYGDMGYFKREYEKYHVTDDVQMEMDDLMDVTVQMMSFLRGDREDLHVDTIVDRQPREFFNEREIAHMEDVQGLFIGALRLRLACIIVIIALIGLLAGIKTDFRHLLPRCFAAGTGIFFVVLLLLTGIISTDFTKYFTLFHKIFFTNDLWLLDPATDLLINIVPEPFFVDTALRIAVIFGFFMIILLAVSLFFIFFPKKKLSKKAARMILLFLTVTVSLSSSLLFSQAIYSPVSELDAWPQGPEIDAGAAILIDVKTGTVLYDKNGKERHYPASTTKIMTALLTIENATLSDTITYSENAIFSLVPGASSIALNPGEQLTVEQSLYALLLPSANDAANGLAEYVAGNMGSFAEMMNTRAKELGALDTHFSNPSGLHDDNHYTTCYDLAMIMMGAIQNETFLKMDSTTYYQIPPTNLQPNYRDLGMNHKMLKKNSEYYYEDCVAGKTGYTDEAGYTLVTYCKRGDMQLVSVIMAASSPQSQYGDTIALMNYGFENFSVYDLSKQNISASQNSSDYFASFRNIFENSSASLSLGNDSWVLLPSSVNISELDSELQYNEDNTDGSSTLATVIYSYQGIQVGSASLTIVNNDKSIFEFDTKTPALFESSDSLLPDHNTVTIYILDFILYVFIGILLAALLICLILFMRPKNIRTRRAKKRRRGRDKRSFRQRHKKDFQD